MTTHSSSLAWRIPWTEDPGGLQPTGLQRVGHNKQLSTHARKSIVALTARPVVGSPKVGPAIRDVIREQTLSLITLWHGLCADGISLSMSRWLLQSQVPAPKQ